MSLQWYLSNYYNLFIVFFFKSTIREGLIDPQKSIQVGIRTFNDDLMGVKILDAEWIYEHSIDDVVEQIRSRGGNNPTYLPFDIDWVDLAYVESNIPVLQQRLFATDFCVYFEIKNDWYVFSI